MRLTIRLVAATNFKNYRELARRSCRAMRAVLDKASTRATCRRDVLLAHLMTTRTSSTASRSTSAACRRRRQAHRRPPPRFPRRPRSATWPRWSSSTAATCSSPPAARAGSRPICRASGTSRSRPPWDSKYTCNINTEMNYWPAVTTNLAECQEPLVDAINELAVSGPRGGQGALRRRAAGSCTTTSISGAARRRSTPRTTASGSPAGPGSASTSGSNTCSPATSSFSPERAYPAMKGAAQFFLDYLVKDPLTGWLDQRAVELARARRAGDGPDDGPRRSSAACSGNTAAAARESGPRRRIRRPARRGAQADRPAPGRPLRPVAGVAGRQGRSQEHSIATSRTSGPSIPAADITWRDEKLFDAARQSLIYRGDAATGWSMGWKVNLWARFLDGDHAYRDPEQPLAADRLGARAGRPVSQSVRRPSALPDRRQFRRRRRHRGDAAAKPRRRGPLAARAAQSLARRQRSRPAGPRRLHGGHRLEIRPAGRRPASNRTTASLCGCAYGKQTLEREARKGADAGA